MTALLTVSETASATASTTTSDAPVAEAKAVARRRSCPTADGAAGSSQSALDSIDARTDTKLPAACGRTSRPASAAVIRARTRSGRSRVDQHQDAAADHLRLLELESASLGQLLEGLLARAEDHGED